MPFKSGKGFNDYVTDLRNPYRRNLKNKVTAFSFYKARGKKTDYEKKGCNFSTPHEDTPRRQCRSHSKNNSQLSRAWDSQGQKECDDKPFFFRLKHPCGEGSHCVTSEPQNHWKHDFSVKPH